MNTNYEALRGGHRERDIYSELMRIEERGNRIKEKKSRFTTLFGRKAIKEDGATLVV